ncbi:MAG: phosphoribosylanthranilate isomerase [Sphingomonadales bacterium]
MSVKVKICGITDENALKSAIHHGASYIGLVFFPPSPRFLDLEEAANLATLAGGKVKRVGIFVDPENALLETVLAHVPLDMLQLHGVETPARVKEIKQKFNKPVVKAIAVSGQADLKLAHQYEGVADMLLFDSARTPGDTRPGGNARRFDHVLLRDENFSLPWLLSGGLNDENLMAAVTQSGAREVDVSSGVEQTPGHKDPVLIQKFLERAADL